MVLAMAEDANRTRDFGWFLMSNSKRVVGICERARINVGWAQTTTKLSSGIQSIGDIAK